MQIRAQSAELVSLFSRVACLDSPIGLWSGVSLNYHAVTILFTHSTIRFKERKFQFSLPLSENHLFQLRTDHPEREFSVVHFLFFLR